MNLILSPHVRISIFEEQGILLDLKKDNYLIFQDKPLEFLLHVAHNGGWKILDGEKKFFQHSYSTKDIPEDVKIARYFWQKEIIVFDDSKRPTRYNVKYNLIHGGVLNLDWRINSLYIFNLTSTNFIKCWMAIVKARFWLKISGLWSFVQYLQKQVQHYQIKNYFYPTHVETESLAHALNKACMYFPGTVLCLEWAVAYMLLAFQKKWRCNLMIGVQTIPFMAHAWVQCDSFVIADDQQLPDRLSVILHEPFSDKEVP